MKLISRIRTLARVRALPEGDLPEVAETVAIIMDGNGRWARQRGLPTAVGHRMGTRALRRTVEAAIDVGIRDVVVYAFSTENWSRPQEEVDALMHYATDAAISTAFGNAKLLKFEVTTKEIVSA